MTQQLELFAIPGQDDQKVALGNNLFVLKNDDKQTAIFFKRQSQIRIINLKDKVTIQVDGTAALYSFLNRGRRTSLFLTDL
jgi:hypothetical protein